MQQREVATNFLNARRDSYKRLIFTRVVFWVVGCRESIRWMLVRRLRRMLVTKRRGLDDNRWWNQVVDSQDSRLTKVRFPVAVIYVALCVAYE